VSRLTYIDGTPHIIIHALRDLLPGEELSYDYMFAKDNNDRVPCSCGAPSCTGWMN
jgi:SET domain-containing protein